MKKPTKKQREVMEKVNITKMTLSEFLEIPYRDKWDKECLCDSIVIIPNQRIHDSGYMCMDFVLIDEGKPICRCGECSDVLCIEGIGGYSSSHRDDRIPEWIPYWSIDCLPVSGLLNLNIRGKKGIKIKVGADLSSFEVISVD